MAVGSRSLRSAWENGARHEGGDLGRAKSLVVPTVRIKDVAAHLNVSHQRGTQPTKIERWAQARVVGDAALEAVALTVPAGTTTLTLCY